MWGRVLAISGGTIILVFAVALLYYDHQKDISIISNWQKNYNALAADKGNVLIENVRLTRQNRELEQQNKQLVADNSVLTDEKAKSFRRSLGFNPKDRHPFGTD